MFKKRDKERERFYLLPGMGGRAYRRKQRLIWKVSVAVGLLVATLFALVIYWINQPHK